MLFKVLSVLVNFLRAGFLSSDLEILPENRLFNVESVSSVARADFFTQCLVQSRIEIIVFCDVAMIKTNGTTAQCQYLTLSSA